MIVSLLQYNAQAGYIYIMYTSSSHIFLDVCFYKNNNLIRTIYIIYIYFTVDIIHNILQIDTLPECYLY